MRRSEATDDRRTPRWLLPALATGAFAVAGAAVASLLANHGSLAVQKAQIAAQRHDERVQAMGAARLLVSELTVALSYAANMQRAGRWVRAGVDRVPVAMRPEDLRLVASQVTGDEWGELLVAMEDAQTVANQMRARVPVGRAVGRPLGPEELAALAHDEDMFQRGIHALNDVAKAPSP
jgi:hypothetical protein